MAYPLDKNPNQAAAANEPLRRSKTLWLARLQSLIGLIAAAFAALPESQQLLWLKQLLPSPLVVLFMCGFALALAWRRLSDQLEREEAERLAQQQNTHNTSQNSPSKKET